MRPTVFTFESTPIRVLIDGDYREWFVARDVAKVLGYSNLSAPIKNHCRYARKQRLKNPSGRTSNTIIIPTPDVFRLIYASKSPIANKFDDWMDETLATTERRRQNLKPDTIEELLNNPTKLLNLLNAYMEEQGMLGL